jgi:predicted HicB family RNase H-like nuclease
MDDKTAPRYIRGKYTTAQGEATAKYTAKAYDRIELKVKKGKKADLQEHAAERGESLNGFVNRAIDEAVVRDKDGGDVNDD